MKNWMKISPGRQVLESLSRLQPCEFFVDTQANPVWGSIFIRDREGCWLTICWDYADVELKFEIYALSVERALKAPAEKGLSVGGYIPHFSNVTLLTRSEWVRTAVAGNQRCQGHLAVLFEHALYVTINDIVLNQGTPHEQRRPFEIFINSKNMDHFQWIVALTRILSAVFRKGGDVTFIVEELKAVFDPRGGYFKAGGVYMPSIVAEIGAVIEQHMKNIGLIHDPEMDEAQKKLVAEKRAAYEAASAGKKAAEVAASSESNASGFPPGRACAPNAIRRRWC